MGTTDPEQETVRGFIRYADKTIEVVSDTAYGDVKKRRSVYPLVLIAIAIVVILAGFPYWAMVPMLLLALWVGGSGR